MIAKYVLIVIAGWGNQSVLTTQEFFSVAHCQKNAQYLKSNKRDIVDAYCTEK